MTRSVLDATCQLVAPDILDAWLLVYTPQEIYDAALAALKEEESK